MAKKNKSNPPFIDYVLGYEDFAESISPKLGNINPFKKTITSSVKEALTLTVKEPSKKPESIPYEFIDDPDELDNLSPSQVSVSINMGDLITNPIGTTKDFIKKSFKSTFNVRGDIDNVIAEENIWKPLVKGQKPGSKEDSSVLERALGAGIYHSVRGLDPFSGAKGVGLSEDVTEGLVHFDRTETAYQMGYGEVAVPADPVAYYQKTFSSGMSSLKSSTKRESTYSNMSMGTLDVLEAHANRDHQHDFSYVLGGDLSELLNSRVDTYADPSAEGSFNQRYSKKNKTKIVDSLGNSAITSSLDRASKSQKELNEHKKAFRDANGKIDSLTNDLNNSTDPRERAQLRDQISTLTSDLKNIEYKVNNSQRQFDRDSAELIGDGTNNGLLQNIVSGASGTSLDENNPEHKKVIETIETYKRATEDSNNFYNLLQDESLHNSTQDLVDVATNAAIQSNDADFNFRSQKKAVEGVHGVSKNIDNLFSKSFDEKKSDSIFSAQDLVSKKDEKIISKLQRKISRETNEQERAKLQNRLNIVQDKSKNGVNNLVSASLSNIQKEKKQLAKLRKQIGGNKKALKEFDRIFGKHERELDKMMNSLSSNEWSKKSLYKFLKKQKSVYSTSTMGGGIKDSTTRKFMRTLYSKNSELGRVFRELEDPDVFKRSKILHKVAQNAYEQELANEALKIFDKGPEGLAGYMTQRYIKERLGIALDADLSVKNVLKETILKPLAFGGLLAGDDLEEELGDAGGLRGFLYRRFGRKFMNAFGKHKFSLKIGGEKLSLMGGSHLGGAVSLGNLINSGKLNDIQIQGILNAKDIKSVEGLLKGLVFKKTDLESLEKDIEKLGSFRDWLKNNPQGIRAAKFLGVKYDKDGNVIFSKKLSNFFTSLAARANNPSLINPTAAFAGALTKFSQFLSVIQGKFKMIYMALRKPIVLLKQVIVQALTTAITGLLSTVTGPLAMVIGVFIRAVVTKLVDLGEKFIKSVFKFDMTEFADFLEDTMKTFAKWFLLILAPFILLWYFIMDPNIFSSSVPTSNTTVKPRSNVVRKYVVPAATSPAPVPPVLPINDCLEDLGIFTAGVDPASDWLDASGPVLVTLYGSDLSFSNQIDEANTIVGRSSNFPDSIPTDVADAIEVLNNNLPNLISNYPKIDVWQGFNEPLYHLTSQGLTEEEAIEWLIEYEQELHSLVTGLGKKVCLGNFKEGFPNNLVSSAVQTYQDTIKDLDNAYLCVHEHEDSISNWDFGKRYNGRFVEINSGAGLPVLVTVTGIDTQAGPTASSGEGYKNAGISDEEYLEMLIDYKNEAFDNNAEGIAIFQVGLGGWDSFDASSLLDLDCSSSSPGTPGGGGGTPVL